MTTPTVPSAPVLGHVEGVELIDTGSWVAASGPWEPVPDDLAAAVAALDCPAVRRPVLKAGHDGNHGIGEPALGYVANLRLANEGQTLVGDYRGMPGWLTDVDTAGQSVLASAYPDRSIEGEYDYRCQLGHTHPFVVHAVALLGVDRPAVGTLESLQELYGVVASEPLSPGGQQVHATIRTSQEPLVPQQVTAAATTDDIRRAYYSGPGSGWAWWIREMYVDPPELIVDNDDDATIWRVPYAVGADGTVTFADAQQVRVEYVTARVSAGQPLVRYAGRAESRPGQRPAASGAPNSPTASPAEDSTTNLEGARMTPEQLRESLGLAADASQIEVAAALAAEGHIPAVEAAPAPEPAETPAAAEPASAPVAAGAGSTVVVDAEAWQRAQQQIAAGAEARAQQLRERRDQLVDAAINDGRIAPSRREHWIAQLEADAGAETVLASLAKNTIPVSEAGHAENDPTVTASSVRETPAYKNWSI